MNIITIDFETYYDREYSLSKMTTEEYIRDERFETIGVSVKVGDGEPVWFSGDTEESHQFLKGFSLQDHLVLAHNAMFDGAILSWVYGIKPKALLDTLCMARALHGTEVGGSLAVLASHYNVGQKGDEVIHALGKRRCDFDAVELARYGAYCSNDVALTYDLFGLMSKNFPWEEMKLIDLTLKMFTDPVLHVDLHVLRTHLEQVKKNKESLLSNTGYSKEELMSNDRLANVLRELLVIPPTKISPTTGKEAYAFAKNDEEFIELLEHPSPNVQAVVAARLGVKSTLEETRTERLIGIGNRGALPVPLRYYAAHTGRWGGDDKLNLQNLPRTSVLKTSICAPDGYVIIDSDSSQIEARTLAWLAGQDDLVSAFEKGEDVYKIMASAIYNKDVSDISTEERFVGKTTILGSGYGMGAVKFKKQLSNFSVVIDAEESKRIIDTYRSTYPQIPKLWQEAQKAIEAMYVNNTAPLGRAGVIQVEGSKGIRLPNGLYLKYPNLRMVASESGKYEYVYDVKKGKARIPTKIYGGKLVENICQALARIIIGEQMLIIARKYRVVMTVHDAVACIAPTNQAEVAKEFVEICMRLRPDWASELPLNCSAGYGLNYGSCG
jgi:DNA polymerase I-like protein with 3'-5' exonuclease and polymerase domains